MGHIWRPAVDLCSLGLGMSAYSGPSQAMGGCADTALSPDGLARTTRAMKSASLALMLAGIVVCIFAERATAQTVEQELPPAPLTSDADAESPHDDSVAEDVVASFGTGVGGTSLGGGPNGSTHRITWREDWPRYSFDEAVLSLGLGVLLVAAEVLPTATTSANWTGGILFDDQVREGLRLRSFDGRESAQVASEILQWVLIATPFVVDAIAVTGFGDGNWDAAFQMGLIALESYVISLVVWKIMVLLARRERPVASACEDGLTTPHCSRDIETTSFFSNQTMNAFTSASLMCLHHTHMPLFGDEAADLSACVVGMTAASMVGLLRIMSDFEYTTDVLMGAVVGFVAGYVIPWAVHYQGGARPELRPPPIALIPVPMVAPGETYGLSVAGWF